MNRDRQGRRQLYGALLISGLVAGALLIFFAADIAKLFRDRYHIVAVLHTAPGLTEDAPVWVGGKAVGVVKQIGFLPGSDSLANLAVTVELPQDVAQQVRADSRLRLTRARPIGPPIIDIVPGTAAAPVLGPGDTLWLQPLPTPEQLMQRAAALRTQLDTALADVRVLAPLISERMQDARQAMDGARLAMAEASQLTAALQGGAGPALLRDAAFQASVQRAQQNIGRLPALFQQMGGRLAGPEGVTPAVARLSARADSLNAQLTALSAMMAGGSALRFQQDTAIVRALNGARAQLDSLIAEARANPARFVF